MPEPDAEPQPAAAAPGAADAEPPGLPAWGERWRAFDPQPPLPEDGGGSPGPWARLKRLLKRWVRRASLGAQRDLWQEQSSYNLRLARDLAEARERERRLTERVEDLLHRLGSLEPELPRLGADLQQVQSELTRDVRRNRETQAEELRQVQEAVLADLRAVRDHHLEYLQSHNDRLDNLEGLENEGFDDLRRHLDALFGRLDQKIDDYRRQSRRLWSELEALLAAAKRPGADALATTAREQDYLALEEIFRGSEAEIERRIDPYLEILSGRGEVLDLGCGRGEALEVLARAGVPCRGVDANAEMVAICREKGLEAEVGELFEILAARPPGGLGGIVSFHVIEHLPPESLDRLVRLAWRGLAEGGVLALETPSPLSLTVAARNFWIDPTHRRPVHPDTLRHIFRRAGFEPVRRIDLQPFAEEERLPELSAEGLGPELARMVQQVNALRDALDRLLFGYQDYGMVGFKPAPAAGPESRADRAAG